jgi:hypothetical protein
VAARQGRCRSRRLGSWGRGVACTLFVGVAALRMHMGMVSPLYVCVGKWVCIVGAGVACPMH